MKERMLCKGLVFAVILLFIGVAIQPGISTNTHDEKTDIDAKDYLFQTILDMVNNQEIQDIIQKSEIRGSLINSLHMPGVIFLLMKLRTNFRLSSLSSFLTKSFLEYAYRMGVKLSRTIDVSKMHSIIQRYQMSNQKVQKEINTVIENNANLKAEITQLSSLNCDCEANGPINWSFPVICTFLFILFFVPYWIWIVTLLATHIELEIMYTIWTTIAKIGLIFDCIWSY
jgi:hypothetical protein